MIRYLNQLSMKAARSDTDWASKSIVDGLSPDRIAQLVEELAALRAEHKTLSARLGQQSMAVPAAAGRIPLGEIQAAVARYMEKNLPVVDPQAASVEGAVPTASPKEYMQKILAGELNAEDASLLWQEVREAGLMDEVLAMFEARAEEDPNDPAKRVELGIAYLNKIQEVGNGPLAGVFATKADQAFDQALEMDGSNWDARFNKAIALTFWPPVFGKQGAAIKEFEILVAQQAQSPLEPAHAQTHLLLGNMHRQLGDSESAIQAWQAGLALFPNNLSLQSQIELNK